MKRRLEKDPTYKRTDARNDLRKRVRDGIATEEDMKKYHELGIKNRASKEKSRLAKKKREGAELGSVSEKRQKTKRRRISQDDTNA